MQTPLKANHRSRVRSEEEEGELTPRASPSMEMVHQRQRYSSEDADVDTSRSSHVHQTQTIVSKTAEGQRSAQYVEQGRGGTEMRSEVRSQLRVENVRRLENRGIGPDQRWDAKGTDSDATRTSSIAR